MEFCKTTLWFTMKPFFLILDEQQWDVLCMRRIEVTISIYNNDMMMAKFASGKRKRK